MSYKKCLLVLLAAVAGCLSIQSLAAAAGNSLYLSPVSERVSQGSTFSVAVRVSTTGANAVQANLTYPASKLTYLSTSYAGSSFEIQAESTGGSGSIHIGRGTLGKVSGDKLVATISFRAAVSSGTAAITFANGSALVNNGTSLSPSFSGSTIYFAAAATAPAAPEADRTPPTISSVEVTSITETGAVISWNTNEPADSTVVYGLNTAYGLTLSSSQKTTRHRVTLSSSFLVPKTTFHFRLSSTDASGNKRVDKDRTFQTLGIPLTVLVQNAAGKALPGVSVTADGATQLSNGKGQAVFRLGYGPHTVSTAYQQPGQSKTITLDNQDIGTNPSVILTLNTNANVLAGWPGYYLLAAFAAGAACGGIVWRLISSRLHGLRAIDIGKLKISLLQRRYGDASPDHNPYARRSLRARLGKLLKLSSK